MDIPAISTSMNQIKLKQEIGVSLAKIVLDSAKSEGAELLKMMEANAEIIEAGIDPSIGANLDIYA